MFATFLCEGTEMQAEVWMDEESFCNVIKTVMAFKKKIDVRLPEERQQE